VEKGDLKAQVKKNERGNFMKTSISLVKDCRIEQSGYILYGIRGNKWNSMKKRSEEKYKWFVYKIDRLKC
jgi:hypothetical protein